MEVGKLTVNVRTESGKGPARKLRARGLVPGVCYGASHAGRVAPVPITVDVKALRGALDPVRKQNTVIELTIADGDKQQVLSALVKDFQVHPLRRNVVHVDLLAIDPTKEVLASVPLEFLGRPKGAIDGGQLRLTLRELEVRAVPAEIPIKISVDVSELEIGDVIHVSGLTLPAGVTTVTGRDQAVVSCAPPEEEEKIETVVAADALAAGAVPGAVPGAPGAAPGAPGAAPGAPGAPGAAPGAPGAAAAGAAPGAPAAAGGKPEKGGKEKGGKRDKK